MPRKPKIQSVNVDKYKEFHDKHSGTIIKSLTEHKLDSELKEWFKRIPDADFEEICKARGVEIVRK